MVEAYRALTPDMRTEWDKAHILDLGDLRFANRLFDVTNIRYWHTTCIVGPHLSFALPALNAVDRLLTRIPGVRLMAWIFTFELHSTK